MLATNKIQKQGSTKQFFAKLLFGLGFMIALVGVVQPVLVARADAQICSPDNSATTYSSNLGRCINNIYIVAIALAGVVALLMFIIAGYMYSTGSTESVHTAKSIIQSTIAALVILIGAYALLNTIDPNFTVVPNIKIPAVTVLTCTNACVEATPVTAGSGTTGTNPPAGGVTPGSTITSSSGQPVTVEPSIAPPTGSGSSFTNPDNSSMVKPVQPCNNCVSSLTAMGLNVKNGDHLEGNLALALKSALTATQGQVNWHITEAWPPSQYHQSDCHFNGQCTDIAIIRSPAPDTLTDDQISQVKALCSALKAQGLTILNEYYRAGDGGAQNGQFAGSDCGNPSLTEFATGGGHLHVTR